MRENFGKGMGGHQSAKMVKDEWLTPPELLRALGEFDLDPCAPIIRPWEIAKKHYTINDDGLSKKWEGRVFCNPPYGEHTDNWLEKLFIHGNGIALIFARTDTQTWFRWVWSKADGALFLEGRLHFHHASGQRAKKNAGAPSALVAYGQQNAEMLKHCGIPGQFITFQTVRTCSTWNKKNAICQTEIGI